MGDLVGFVGGGLVGFIGVLSSPYFDANKLQQRHHLMIELDSRKLPLIDIFG